MSKTAVPPNKPKVVEKKKGLYKNLISGVK